MQQQTRAPGRPFDYGTFAIIEEDCDEPWPADDVLHFTADKVRWPPGWPDGTEPDERCRPLVGAATSPESTAVSPDARPWQQVNPYTNPAAVLPRRAWANQLAFLRAAFRAKRALDEAEAAGDLVLVWQPSSC